MKNIYRTHNCNDLNKENLGQNIMLSGWVHRKRDHGGLLFIDVRDHFGITQLIFEPDVKFFAEAEKLRVESCINIEGEVLARDDEALNTTLNTGEIEVKVTSLTVLSHADDLPLPVFGEPEYPEDIRLKYRYIDLRRTSIHDRMIKRSKIISKIRSLMEEKDFNEFQTPILTASSPEGARDFIVPSRLHPTKFYALPQAPQIFKQLLMVAGFEKYFQIAPCFRDEDARADRSAGEFYQLDIEMSFVTQEDIFAHLEPILFNVFNDFADGQKVDQYPFRQIAYDDSMLKYGTDKPDLRNPIEMQDVSEVFVESGFKIFSQILAKDKENMILAIPAPKGGSRAFCDRMNGWAQKQGLPGMGYIIYGTNEAGEEEAKGPIAKNIGHEKSEQLKEMLNLKKDDAAFFLAGKPEDFRAIASEARQKVAQELDLMDDGFAFCWIVDFPMFEWDKENKKVEFGHNPFSMPQGDLASLDNADPLSIKAQQYDLVCNGYELGSGAIRNHHRDIMVKAFSIAGYDEAFVKQNFGGMYEAFRFGAPPHGGAAFGIERIVMLLTGEQNIREVSIFPLNQQAEDLLLGAPANIPEGNLKDVHVKTVMPISKK